MRLRPSLLRSAGRAVLELLLARIHLARSTPSKLIADLSVSNDREPLSTGNVPDDVQRVAYLVPRVAARLPWRSDCLVQALAARRWLASLGYKTVLSRGTRNSAGKFEAHAWLKWQDFIVTGGNIESYAELRSVDIRCPGDRAR